MMTSGKIDISILERKIRLSLIIDEPDIYIDRFNQLTDDMVSIQTNIYGVERGEYVCYKPNGNNLENWSFYLNVENDNIYINESFWEKYHSVFDRVNTEEIFIYFKILVLSRFGLEDQFDEPSIHLSFQDERIANTKL